MGTSGPFAVEVIADSSEEWVGNGISFSSKAEAEEYAKDLWSRWTAVRSWRIVERVHAGWLTIRRIVGVSV